MASQTGERFFGGAIFLRGQPRKSLFRRKPERAVAVADRRHAFSVGQPVGAREVADEAYLQEMATVQNNLSGLFGQAQRLDEVGDDPSGELSQSRSCAAR